MTVTYGQTVRKRDMKNLEGFRFLTFGYGTLKNVNIFAQSYKGNMSSINVLNGPNMTPYLIRLYRLSVPKISRSPSRK